MKFIVFADIHGNIQAFNSVARGFSRHDKSEIICVGDIVGYGADPEGCIDLVRELGAKCVLGNHDAALVKKVDITRFNQYAAQAILWTEKNISQRGLDYLDGLDLVFGNEYFDVVHGSLNDPERFEYLLDKTDARRTFKVLKQKICFVAHTHIPMVFSYSKCLVERLPGKTFILDKDARYVVNVGSVGQPRDNDPRACYCTYDTDKQEVSFHRLEYDVEAARDAILKEGLPVSNGNRLIYGQ
ncbi:MAG: metallophosphoesterase family protein [Candidatus Omnitrophica bacterium]|nr:metallophosphoesterase family protein [Candidatus Omnitrophota bacterium]